MSYLWHDGFDAYGVEGSDYSSGTDLDAGLVSQGYFTSEPYVGSPASRTSDDTIDGIGYSMLPNTGGYWPGGPGRYLGAQEGVVVGFQMKLTRVDSGIGTQAIFRDGQYYVPDETYTPHMNFSVNAAGGLICETGDNANTYTSPDGVIFPGVWQRIEIKHIIGQQPQILQIKVDGVSVLSIVAQPTVEFSTSDDNSVSGTSVGSFTSTTKTDIGFFITDFNGLGSATTSTTTSSTTALQNASEPDHMNFVQFTSDARLNMRADHFYVLSTDGNTPCDFLGNVRVRTMLPAGAGAEQQFRQIGGNLHGAYTSVNTFPYVGDTACIADNTAGQTELFKPDVVPASVIDIFAVAVTAVVRGGTGGESYNLALSDGTNTEISASETCPASYGYVQQNFPKAPDGGFWSYEDLTELQFGVKVGS